MASVALAVVLLLQLPVIFNRAVNWDEFYHYSLLHKLAQGTITEPLQTLFTRIFVWAIYLPGSGIDHLVVIRVCMFACELITVAAIIGTASRFSDRTTAVLCALAYVSAGYVFRHATSFRFDPPATALLMSALYVLVRRPLDVRYIALVGLLVGIAGLWTIKAVLYLPAFAGVLWLRWSEQGFSRAYLARIAATGVATLLAFGVLYLLHSQGLGATANDESERLVGAAAAKMFGIGYMPYWPLHLRGVAMAPLLTAMILAFPLVIWRQERPISERIALIGLYLPITTLLFYHNTAPYYFVYVLPPVVVACCVVLRLATARYGMAAIAGLLLLNGALMLAFEPSRSPMDKQRVLLRAADEIFGKPVAYFDSYAMLGDFQKANVFMTPWGTEMYRAGVFPSLREIMASKPVPLVIDDADRFGLGLTGSATAPSLRPGDLEALRANYLAYWGPFWVAGKHVRADGKEHLEEFLVPGPYTVRLAPVIVDGQIHPVGEVISIDRGFHRLRVEGAIEGRLVWGNDLGAPEGPPPSPPYWVDF